MTPIQFATAETEPAEYGFHDAAAIFDLLEGAAFDEFVDDIRKHGQKIPIVLFEGKILDGRNRYRACRAAGIDPIFRTWDGQGSASELVWSLNHVRRHLHGNARALAAGRYAVSLQEESRKRQLANLKRGTQSPRSAKADVGKTERTHETAAREADVPAATVERAVKVVKDGTPELQQAVAQDKISITSAAEVAAEAPDVQREIANHPEIKKAVKALKNAKALKDEADAMPVRPAPTPAEAAEHRRIFGTQEDRAALMDVLAVTKLVTKLPAPADMVAAVPPALEHAVDPIALLKAADWFGEFARAWEARGAVE